MIPNKKSEKTPLKNIYLQYSLTTQIAPQKTKIKDSCEFLSYLGCINLSGLLPFDGLSIGLKNTFLHLSWNLDQIYKQV